MLPCFVCVESLMGMPHNMQLPCPVGQVEELREEKEAVLQAAK